MSSKSDTSYFAGVRTSSGVPVQFAYPAAIEQGNKQLEQLKEEFSRDIEKVPWKVLHACSLPPRIGDRERPDCYRDLDGWIIPPQSNKFLFRSGEKTPESDLGLLSTLPNELLLNIVSKLDLKSTFRLSKVNRYARRILSDIRELKMLSTYTHGALLRFFEVALADRVTISQLFQTLNFMACTMNEDCQNFGDLVFMPTCRRFCWDCFRAFSEYAHEGNVTADGYEFVVYPMKHLARASGVGVRELKKKIPNFKSITTKKRYSLAKRSPTILAHHNDVAKHYPLIALQVKKDDIFETDKGSCLATPSATVSFPYFNKDWELKRMGFSVMDAETSLEQATL